MIKGVIFDFDGTLVNTLEDIADSVNIVLEEYDKETFTYDEFRKKIGGGFHKLVYETFGKDIDDSLHSEVLKKLEESYDRNYLNKTKPYDGIDSLLSKLLDKGIKVGINTNKDQDYTEKIVDKLFKDIPFVKIVGVQEGMKVKPDPTGGKIVFEAMELEKSDVLYVGDSNIDMLAAKNLGLKSVGVDWGFRGEEELREFGADYIVYKPSEILNIL